MELKKGGLLLAWSKEGKQWEKTADNGKTEDNRAGFSFLLGFIYMCSFLLGVAEP